MWTDIEGGGVGLTERKRGGAYGPCAQEHGVGRAQEVAATGKAKIVVESDGFGHEDWGPHTELRLDRKAEQQKVVLGLYNGETD